MSSKNSAKNNSKSAVFSRNHRVYLEQAVKLGEVDPGRCVALRSGKRWVSAKKAIEAHGPRRIYFAVNDEDNEVQFSARLDDVIIDPDVDNLEHKKRLMECELKDTQGEEFWDGQVKSLYFISNCRFEEPFPITELHLLDGGAPLSKDYARSYALVWARNESPD